MRTMLQRTLPGVSSYFLFFILWIMVLFPHDSMAQKDFLQDSLKRKLSAAGTDEEKVFALMKLATYYTELNNGLSDQYASQALEIAELNRDRKLIVSVLLQNGERLLKVPGLSGKLSEALGNLQNAEKVARENGMDNELAYCYVDISAVYLRSGNYDKALDYNNLSLSIVSSSTSDSLKVIAYTGIGHTYDYRDEELLAFRNYLEALNIAELSKNEQLLKIVYRDLSVFYTNLDEHDKAIDYQMKVLAIDRKYGDRYELLNDYNNIGKAFQRKKDIELSQAMYERAVALGDSLQYPSSQLTSYLNIANLYFDNNQTVRGMDYLHKHPEIMSFFRNTGLGFFLDEGIGWIYSDLGKLDSAYYYLQKAAPEIEQKANPGGKYEFYRKFAYYYKKRGDSKGAIAYYLKGRNIGLTTKTMEMITESDKNLDSLYKAMGDFQTAYVYNTEYNLYKDSIKTLSKATDMLKLEVDNDNRRHERLLKEEEENTQRRHNIQYMGFTAGLAGIFVLLVMMGLFVVSPRTIRAIGFFSFIFLFEFIILLADKSIHEWTHGEPWKILCIKVLLAAILLPLHHELEHKVIHYLTHRRKFSPSARPVWAGLFRKPAPVGDSPEAEGNAERGS